MRIHKIISINEHSKLNNLETRKKNGKSINSRIKYSIIDLKTSPLMFLRQVARNRLKLGLSVLLFSAINVQPIKQDELIILNLRKFQMQPLPGLDIMEFFLLIKNELRKKGCSYTFLWIQI